MPALVAGVCDPQFSALSDLLSDELESGRAVGQAIAVVVDGETVVDLWGGYRDAARKQQWESDTSVCLFSAGKAIATAAVLKLVERGLVELHQPVSLYWPEFAGGGKREITVRQALAHLAGVPIAVAAPARSVYERRVLLEALERQVPLWPAGLQGCFHSFTHGLLTGELVRRVDGRSLGPFFREEFAAPFALSLGFSLDGSEQAKCADVMLVEDNPLLRMMRDPATLLGQSWRPMRWDELNSAEFRSCDFPSLAGHGSALGLARFYGMMACGGLLEGERVLDEAVVRLALTEQWHQVDPFMGAPVRMGLGVMLSNEVFPFTGSQTSFAQPGLGGVAGIGDTEARVGIGVAPNLLSAGIANPFLDSVIAAVLHNL